MHRVFLFATECIAWVRAEREWGLVVVVGVGVGATTNSANEVLHDFHINVQASRRVQTDDCGPIQSGALEQPTCPWFAIKNNVAAHCGDEILSICAPLWSRWNVLV